jgi:membrane-associated phospholipid phosphatase
LRAGAERLIDLPLAVPTAISGLGESALLIVTAAFLAGWFWVSRQHAMALGWLLAVGGCAASMFLVKLGFLTCGHLILAAGIRSPSGHTAMAEVFYGAAAITLNSALAAHARSRLVGLALAAAVVVAVSLSRLMVHAHSAPEVVTGLAVGAVWLVGFVRLKRKVPVIAIPRAVLILGLVVVYGGFLAVVESGTHITAEGLLSHIALVLQQSAHVCTPD